MDVSVCVTADLALYSTEGKWESGEKARTKKVLRKVSINALGFQIVDKDLMLVSLYQ